MEIITKVEEWKESQTQPCHQGLCSSCLLEQEKRDPGHVSFRFEKTTVFAQINDRREGWISVKFVSTVPRRESEVLQIKVTTQHMDFTLWKYLLGFKIKCQVEIFQGKRRDPDLIGKWNNFQITRGLSWLVLSRANTQTGVYSSLYLK